MGWLLVGPYIASGWGLVLKRSSTCFESWGLWVSLTSREPSGAGDWVQLHGWWFNQSWLNYKTTIRSLMEDTDVPRRWHVLTPCKDGMGTLHHSISERTLCIFYSKTVIIKYSTFTSSVSHSSTLSNMRGLWEPSNL